MSALSDYLEAALLDLVFNGQGVTPPATYIALHTVDPTDAGTGDEVSGGSYARVLVNASGGASPAWTDAVEDGVGHKVANADDIVFPQATAYWGVVGYFGIWDADLQGNLLYHGPLDDAKTITTGDTFRFTAGNLKLRME